MKEDFAQRRKERRGEYQPALRSLRLCANIVFAFGAKRPLLAIPMVDCLARKRTLQRDPLLG
jgi:hypothetical protein